MFQLVIELLILIEHNWLFSIWNPTHRKLTHTLLSRKSKRKPTGWQLNWLVFWIKGGKSFSTVVTRVPIYPILEDRCSSFFQDLEKLKPCTKLYSSVIFLFISITDSFYFFIELSKSINLLRQYVIYVETWSWRWRTLFVGHFAVAFADNQRGAVTHLSPIARAEEELPQNHPVDQHRRELDHRTRHRLRHRLLSPQATRRRSQHQFLLSEGIITPWSMKINSGFDCEWTKLIIFLDLFIFFFTSFFNHVH